MKISPKESFEKLTNTTPLYPEKNWSDTSFYWVGSYKYRSVDGTYEVDCYVNYWAGASHRFRVSMQFSNTEREEREIYCRSHAELSVNYIKERVISQMIADEICDVTWWNLINK